MCDLTPFAMGVNSKGEENTFGGMWGELTFPGYGRLKLEELSRETWWKNRKSFRNTNDAYFGPYRMVGGESIVIRIKFDWAFIMLKDKDGKDIDFVRVSKFAAALRDSVTSGPCIDCLEYQEKMRSDN